MQQLYAATPNRFTPLRGELVAQAKEAGLIAKPDKASCTKSCHKPAEITDDKLATVHAHKAKT